MTGQKLMADGSSIMKNWKDSQCKFILVDPNEEEGIIAILERIKSVEKNTGKCIYEELPDLSSVITIICGDHQDSFLDLLENEPEMFVDDSVTEHDLTFLFCTSGSTGFAKLVPHSFYTVYMITKHAMSITAQMTSNSVLLCPAPMGWLAGCPMYYPAIGITRVIMDFTNGSFQNVGENLVNMLEDDKCDSAFLGPSMVIDIVNELNTRNPKRSLESLLSTCITGTCPISRVVLEAIGTISRRVSCIYGGTEFGTVCCEVVENPECYEDCCVGIPHKDMDIKILDEDFNEVPIGTNGELYIRTPYLSNGYYNNKNETAKAFLYDGWYRTSDIGHLNQDGKLFVYCRKSYALNYYGCTHYPGWIEAKIDTHPQIQKSVVIGVKDALLYDHVCACIVKAPNSSLTSEQAFEFCKGLFLSKCNERISPVPEMILFIHKFPLLNNSKIDRKQLRERAMQRLEEMQLVRDGIFFSDS